MTVIFIIIAFIIIEAIFKPRLDYIAYDNKLLLWYGRRKRKYLKIY